MSLEGTIKKLIATNKEGDYWDFKSKHHENAGDLIKDVICLANTVRHSGDRYIIFGVENGTCAINGVPAQDRKTQADIIDTLGKAGFAGNLYPDIFLREISLDGKILDVLIIKDTPEKPFYLQREYNKQGFRLNPGTIYTRVRDANTQTDQVAPASDIEKMWRERFGLDVTQKEKLERYLLDFENWEEVGENKWYYKLFPEFTVCPTEEETWEVEGGENWVRACTNPKAFVRPMYLKFHQTVLAKVTCIYFDEMRGLIPAPQATFIKNSCQDYFYSLTGDQFDFIFLQFLLKRTKQKIFEEGLLEPRMGRLSIAVFITTEEKDKFLRSLSEVDIKVEERHQFIGAKIEPLIKDRDREIISYSRAVIERLDEYRKGGSV